MCIVSVQNVFCVSVFWDEKPVIKNSFETSGNQSFLTKT